MGAIEAISRQVWQGRPWSFGLLGALLLGAVLRLLWGITSADAPASALSRARRGLAGDGPVTPSWAPPP